MRFATFLGFAAIAVAAPVAQWAEEEPAYRPRKYLAFVDIEDFKY
jgi:hypothetical protein